MSFAIAFFLFAMSIGTGPTGFKCIYAVTVFLAPCLAWRLRFSEYKLRIITGPVSAFVGCLLLWPYCVQLFLYNLFRVRSGLATKKSVPEAGDDPNFHWAMMASIVLGTVMTFFGAMTIPSMAAAWTQGAFK